MIILDHSPNRDFPLYLFAHPFLQAVPVSADALFPAYRDGYNYHPRPEIIFQLVRFEYVVLVILFDQLCHQHLLDHSLAQIESLLQFQIFFYDFIPHYLECLPLAIFLKVVVPMLKLLRLFVEVQHLLFLKVFALRKRGFLPVF